MKIKKFKFKQILKLHLLKSRTYEQAIKKNNSNFLVDINLTQIINNLKKALQVIFYYHQADKRILFIGVPKKLELKINRLTNHVAVPHNFNLQGIISNNFKSSSVKKETGLKSFLPKLAKKPDLVVLFFHEKNIVSESYFAKVPLIVFNNDENSKNSLFNNFYSVQGNGNNLTAIYNKNLFCIGLNFLFKTVKRKVRKQNSTSFVSKNFNSNFKSGGKRFT
jgi:ribosomal protein S2